MNPLETTNTKTEALFIAEVIALHSMNVLKLD